MPTTTESPITGSPVYLPRGARREADSACALTANPSSSGVVHTWHFLVFDGEGVVMIGEDCAGYKVENLTREAARETYSRLTAGAFQPAKGRVMPYTNVGLDRYGRYEFGRSK